MLMTHLHTYEYKRGSLIKVCVSTVFVFCKVIHLMKSLAGGFPLAFVIKVESTLITVLSVFVCVPTLQASLWFASWCCCLLTSPGLRSASPGWAWCTSWPACRLSWALCSTTSSWTTREGSRSTTPSSSSTCVESAWSTRWVGFLRGSADCLTVCHFGPVVGRRSLIAGLFALRVGFFFIDRQWFTVQVCCLNVYHYWFVRTHFTT